jgi:hypothetical protein
VNILSQKYAEVFRRIYMNVVIWHRETCYLQPPSKSVCLSDATRPHYTPLPFRLRSLGRPEARTRVLWPGVPVASEDSAVAQIWPINAIELEPRAQCRRRDLGLKCLVQKMESLVQEGLLALQVNYCSQTTEV